MAEGLSALEAQCTAAETAGKPHGDHQFEAIVADGDDGIIIVESSGVIAYANEAAEFLLGHGRADLRGDIFSVLLTPGDPPISVNAVARDRSLRLVEMRMEPLSQPCDGRRVVRIRDVTGYHSSVCEARQEVKKRDEFIAMLSHELRNPLAAIRSAATLLAIDDLPPSTRAEASAITVRQFDHLTRILDDLLDVARILRGKLVLAPERVELNQVILDAVAAIQPQIDRNGQELSVEIPAARLWIWGDGTRLEQIAANLLGNAAKFSPPGSRLRLSATVEGKNVHIRVRDRGPGIPAELRPHIFEAFVQGPQPLDRGDGGLGIGLMLVRQFTQLHGGSVFASDNADGIGTCMSVTLPLIEAEENELDSAAPSRQSGPLKILLVEDCNDVRRMLKWVLERIGFEVSEAGAGSEGLARLLADPVDVAIIDIGLPEMNGYDLVRRFHRQKQGACPKLVAVTGYGRPEDVAAAKQAGFDEHLVKPVELGELRALLERFRRDLGVSDVTNENARDQSRRTDHGG